MAATTKHSADRPSPAAERILAAASRLFYERGIRAVGVNTIAERAGVTKVTLYAHFGSKDGLVAAHLHARDQRWWTALEEFIAGHPDPKERLLAIFDAYRAWTVADEFRGCGFVNAATELTDPEHPGRSIIGDHKENIRRHLETVATAAGCAHPEDVAEEWFLLLEGAVVTASLRHNADPLHRARQAALRLLPSTRPE